MSQVTKFNRVTKDYDVAYPTPIKLKTGDAVTITKRETNPDWLGWVFCLREDGVGGWVSETYLEINGNQATAIKSYDATELKVSLGEIVERRNDEFGWAWVRNREMKEGWVPLSHLASSTYPPVRIRLAQAGDENEIANVHLNSWRESYKGLLPPEFLDQLPLTFKRRRDDWKTVIQKKEKFVLFVAEAPEGLVGFACFRQGVDAGWESTAELGATYLLEKYKGSGVGFNLLSAGFKVMQGRGFKRGFCWALKGNPTIAFYERTGATFTGDTKDDVIGGQVCSEMRFEWKSIGFTDYDWEPISIEEIQRELGDLKCHWAIGGGWAIDLFLATQTRKHDDVDVLVPRQDQTKLHDALPYWELWVSDPPGTLRPWPKGEDLGPGIQDIWCRKLESKTWRFQIMLFDIEAGNWIFKRDPTVRRPLGDTILSDANGIRYLAPEVQLLNKARGLRAKDQQDFESALPQLTTEGRAWLRKNLMTVDRAHPWLARLEGNMK